MVGIVGAILALVVVVVHSRVVLIQRRREVSLARDEPVGSPVAEVQLGSYLPSSKALWLAPG